MRFRGSSRILMSLLAVCFVFVSFASTASAAAGDRYKQQAVQFSKMLEQQAEADQTDAASEDRQRTRKWLESVEVLLAKGNDKAAARLLKRVEFSLQLMQAMITASNIQAAADDQEEAYYKAKEQKIPEIKQEIETLQDQKKELEKELEKLR